MMETLEKPDKTRGHSDGGCGEVCLESQKQINFMEISVNRKPQSFSWNSRNLEETVSTWSKSGVQREKDQLWKGEPAGNEIEKPRPEEICQRWSRPYLETAV